jgi:hypothetical protein
MTPNERFLTALNGGASDRVPIEEHLFSLMLQKKEIIHYHNSL